jgi:hypothetical protein
LPVKTGAKKSVRQERTVFWIERAGELLVWQRAAGSRLMPGFWELPEAAQLPAAAPGRRLGTFKHGITIHDYRFAVAEAGVPRELNGCLWRPFSELESAPLSTIFRKAMRIVEKGKHSKALAASAG